MNETIQRNPADWDDLQLFLAVARAGGLSPAARATGKSAATLGRRMRALERSLNQELFVRHDRGYTLTTAACTLRDDLTAVETRILRATTAMAQDTRPLVKISAGTWTTLQLTRHLHAIIGAPADIKLRLISAETTLSIARREAVIGFRNHRPTDAALAGRKISRVDFAPYTTASAPDLWIKVVADTPSATWLDKRIGTHAICDVSTPRNSLDLALGGVGRVLLPTFIGDAQPDLHRVGDPIPELTHDQWIVTHQDDRHQPEIRRTLDRLYDIFAQP